MQNKWKNRIIILTSALVLLLMFYIILLLTTTGINEKNKKMLNMNNDYVKIVLEVAKKNGNWKNLPLSKKFKKKYNSKEGILLKDNYSAIGSASINSSQDKQIVCLIVKHNYNRKTEDYYIHYVLNDKNELDDIEIIRKEFIEEYDEFGNDMNPNLDPLPEVEEKYYDSFIDQFCRVPYDTIVDYDKHVWEYFLFDENYKMTMPYNKSILGNEFTKNHVRKVNILDGTDFNTLIAYVQVSNGVVSKKYKLQFSKNLLGEINNCIIESIE